MGNELSHRALPINSAVSRIEISSELCNCSQSDCLRGNRDGAHGNLPKVTRPFPVRDTESDPRLGWLGLACETSLADRY